MFKKTLIKLLYIFLAIPSISQGQISTHNTFNSFAFTKDNSVYGLKNGQLYSYVDLSGDINELKKLNEDAIVKIILNASKKSAAEWWKLPKFSTANSGVIDVITILNKDEYAKADFSSSLQHGKVYLRRTNGEVIIEKNTLNFSNLKNIKSQ